MKRFSDEWWIQSSTYDFGNWPVIRALTTYILGSVTLMSLLAVFAYFAAQGYGWGAGLAIGTGIFGGMAFLVTTFEICELLGGIEP
jgi:hypothetical protein